MRDFLEEYGSKVAFVVLALVTWWFITFAVAYSRDLEFQKEDPVGFAACEVWEDSRWVFMPFRMGLRYESAEIARYASTDAIRALPDEPSPENFDRAMYLTASPEEIRTACEDAGYKFDNHRAGSAPEVRDYSDVFPDELNERLAELAQR